MANMCLRVMKPPSRSLSFSPSSASIYFLSFSCSIEG